MNSEGIGTKPLVNNHLEFNHNMFMTECTLLLNYFQTITKKHADIHASYIDFKTDIDGLCNCDVQEITVLILSD